jgi:uncharacterized protein
LPRPRKCRYVENPQPGKCFRVSQDTRIPRDATIIFLDEIEAIRLADTEGLTQEEAALRMEISRPTFARLINEAHRKIADAILSGKSIVTEGDDATIEESVEKRIFKCDDCDHEWGLDCGAGCPDKCPKCEGANYRRANCGLHYQRKCGCKGDVEHHHICRPVAPGCEHTCRIKGGSK